MSYYPSAWTTFTLITKLSSKTQAVAELSLELILIDKTIQIDYAPCALNKDLIVFKNFDILLDKLLNNK